ncbi:putative bifunctional diguanylate cyclase/phosphodiesterase [Sphingobium algorifonticola]|uniref:EAL domain-containing protein n=1 Tax=Sphingobium algorifonticola TaxID=2008318 RepID=A0A437J5Z2_9SPHN|nr:EAL domain-containing protein [Sphingobium algorifonticola]RVT40337.1 EAL domain-containing protein [Sphingobium algorifonticola]
MMGLAPVRVGTGAQHYRAQLESADRLHGIQFVLHLFALLFVWNVFGSRVPQWLLAGWSAVSFGLMLLQLHGSRLRLHSDYAQVGRRDILGQGALVGAQGLLWLAAMLLFPPALDAAALIALWTLASCLMVGAAVTYSALPLASVGFLLAAGSGAVLLFERSYGLHLPLLAASYALVLLIGSLKHARAFGRQLGTNTELADKREVVSLLLREYEDSGSDWLWQTDSLRRITGVSPRFAATMGVTPADLEGKPLLQILAGRDWETGDFTPVLRDLAERLKRRESFSNVVLPVEVGQETHWLELSASPRYSDQGDYIGFRGVGSDVTEQRESANRIAQLARFDPLTNLPNRLQLSEALATAIDAVMKWNSRCAFLMVDLDRFKSVNDTLGHQVGDKLLEQVAARLIEICGPHETCGRIGGDEFAIVMRDFGDPVRIAQLANTVIDILSQPYDVDDNLLYIGASVGSAMAPRDGSSTETLIRSADLALYRAKDEGGGIHCQYEPKLHIHAEERRTLEIALREALEKDQLHVVYQPVVNARTGACEGFETLVRWTHPEMGAISPAKFIPVAEDARLIAPIGEWVLRTACQEAMHWPSDIRVAVNVSAEQLHNHQFVACVISALAQSGLPAHRLELEVTESVFMREGTVATQVLDQLLGLGIRLSLDDFGTGYSSLGYLSRTKFTTIKIDRSFVVNAAKNVPEALAIVRAVVALADSLGMATTAEGVETEAEVDMVNALGCTKIQGYFFGRPMPAEEARQLFRRTGGISAVA